MKQLSMRTRIFMAASATACAAFTVYSLSAHWEIPH